MCLQIINYTNSTKIYNQNFGVKSLNFRKEIIEKFNKIVLKITTSNHSIPNENPLSLDK